MYISCKGRSDSRAGGLGYASVAAYAAYARRQQSDPNDPSTWRGDHRLQRNTARLDGLVGLEGTPRYKWPGGSSGDVDDAGIQYGTAWETVFQTLTKEQAEKSTVKYKWDGGSAGTTDDIGIPYGSSALEAYLYLHPEERPSPIEFNRPASSTGLPVSDEDLAMLGVVGAVILGAAIIIVRNRRKKKREGK